MLALRGVREEGGVGGVYQGDFVLRKVGKIQEKGLYFHNIKRESWLYLKFSKKVVGFGQLMLFSRKFVKVECVLIGYLLIILEDVCLFG